MFSPKWVRRFCAKSYSIPPVCGFSARRGFIFYPDTVTSLVWKFIGWQRSWVKPNNSMQLSTRSKIGQAGNYNKNGGTNFDLLPKEFD